MTDEDREIVRQCPDCGFIISEEEYRMSAYDYECEYGKKRYSRYEIKEIGEAVKTRLRK